MKEVPSRLRWACRRGMLELDVLLGNYLEEAYLESSAQDQETFVKLLSCNDQELFEWFTDKAQPSDSNFVKIVNKIREHARNRH